MGKALEVVNQYYDLLNNKNFSGMKDLLSENMLFIGPVVQRSGANEYVDALKRLFKFHKKSQMLKQFENGKDVCSIYDLIMDKPGGGGLVINGGTADGASGSTNGNGNAGNGGIAIGAGSAANGKTPLLFCDKL